MQLSQGQTVSLRSKRTTVTVSYQLITKVGSDQCHCVVVHLEVLV